MLLDLSWILLRTLLLVASLQAAGGVLFLALMGADAAPISVPVRRLVRWAAALGVLLALLLQLLASVRMAGDWSGLLESSLQRLAWLGRDGQARSLQMAALLGLAAATPTHRLSWRALAAAGLVILSFTLTGHTSVHAARWLLAPLLVVHLAIVAFWFGSLLPLLQACRVLSAAQIAALLRHFSAVAVLTVPLIAVVGVVMAAVLLPWPVAADNPYPWLLAGKLVLFAVLMMLAALNRSLFTDQLQVAAERAAARLRGSMGTEIALIVAVLVLTVLLTTLYSP
ncbi:MAG: CopD family protein [Steroidobacteraceae bacterium]